ncbi:hypothetical protein ACFWUU_14755 [Kribbella sp. NPDC058693]|uniref:hypothetical protein n=1 Tax=Kribbella sp. NPDC058693 TaxID=3346602 RepID=UPI00364AA54A
MLLAPLAATAWPEVPDRRAAAGDERRPHPPTWLTAVYPVRLFTTLTGLFGGVLLADAIRSGVADVLGTMLLKATSTGSAAVDS